MDRTKCDLKRIEQGLRKYEEICNLFDSMDDVSNNKEFQTKFDGFYRVRRNQEWRDYYFKLMQKNKNNEKVSFNDIISSIYNITGRVEASFSSKLVSMINRNLPIWDQYVLQNLNIKPIQQSLDNLERVKKSVLIYERIIDWYKMYLLSNNGQDDIKFFDLHFPQYTYLSDIKKIDFLLWSIR